MKKSRTVPSWWVFGKERKGKYERKEKMRKRKKERRNEYERNGLQRE